MEGYPGFFESKNISISNAVKKGRVNDKFDTITSRKIHFFTVK
jgi:hypothetical protein